MTSSQGPAWFLPTHTAPPLRGEHVASPSGDSASSDLRTVPAHPISHGSASHGQASEPAEDPTFQPLLFITSPDKERELFCLLFHS